jgi:hypothetical protein
MKREFLSGESMERVLKITRISNPTANCLFPTHGHKNIHWPWSEKRWRDEAKVIISAKTQDLHSIQTGILLKNAVFWDVTLCGCCRNLHLGEKYCLNHQSNENRHFLRSGFGCYVLLMFS